MHKRILIVEDEHKIAGILIEYLQQSNYTVQHLSRGDDAANWLLAHDVDLVLLDLMLPGKNGLDLCKELRAGRYVSKAPGIIMITARVEEIDRLLGLELGADDYICKPFSPREVVARVKAVFRRTEHAAHLAQAAGAPVAHMLQFDDGAWTARLAGEDLDLTVVEYQLLKVLSTQPGRIYTRGQLIQSMYRDERVVSDRTVDSHIKKLRRKLEERVPDQELIQSVYGLGYKYTPPSL